MKTIELIGQVDEQHRLHVELPADIQPGPVRVIVRAATEEDEEDDWRAFINQAWARDWNDLREEIYTLEDGESSHGAR